MDLKCNPSMKILIDVNGLQATDFVLYDDTQQYSAVCVCWEDGKGVESPNGKPKCSQYATSGSLSTV